VNNKLHNKIHTVQRLHLTGQRQSNAMFKERFFIFRLKISTSISPEFRGKSVPDLARACEKQLSSNLSLVNLSVSVGQLELNFSRVVSGS